MGWALVGKFLNSFPLLFFSSYMQRERKFPSIYNNWNCFWTNDIRGCVFVSSQADLHEKMEGRNVSSSLFVHRKQNLVPTHIANEVAEQGICAVLNQSSSFSFGHLVNNRKFPLKKWPELGTFEMNNTAREVRFW